jgi:hypothetical protein
MVVVEGWRLRVGLEDCRKDRRILSRVSTAQKPPHLYSTVQYSRTRATNELAILTCYRLMSRGP